MLPIEGMASSDRPRRLFAALYPSAVQARALAAAAADLALPGVRLVPAEQIHLTALFIGPVPERRLASVQHSLQAAAQGVRAFRLEDLRWERLPERGPARLVAAVAPRCPASLEELVRRLSLRLGPRGASPGEFWPHLTVLRLPAPRELALPNPAAPLPALCFEELALVESRLGPRGADHRRLVTLSLQPDGR
jgi:2'-5' RNA ligase